MESLNLDNVRASELSGLSDEYVRLKRISMINVGLTSLQGLPTLPALEIVSINYHASGAWASCATGNAWLPCITIYGYSCLWSIVHNKSCDWIIKSLTSSLWQQIIVFIVNTLQLEMGDNKLSGGLDVLEKCPSLKEINLCGNRIATFDDLKALVSVW